MLRPPRINFWTEFKSAARANWLPALVLQGVAFTILVCYLWAPGGREEMHALAAWKERVGWPFVVTSSAFAGALLPFCLQSLQKGDHRRFALSTLPVFLLFWGGRGLVIDRFYDLQARLWGDDARLVTILAKIFFDMGLFSPLLAIPSIAIMFAWADSSFSPRGLTSFFEPGWYGRRIWPLVRAAWVVWIPTVAVIYALPQGLQFPVQVIIQCFWVLLLVVLTSDQQSPRDETPRVLATPGESLS